jgi:hypothetical protein
LPAPVGGSVQEIKAGEAYPRPPIPRYSECLASSAAAADPSLLPSDAFHKVKYSAGCLFRSGATIVSRQIIGLECVRERSSEVGG